MTTTGHSHQEFVILLLMLLPSVLLYLVQVYMIQIVDIADFSLAVVIESCPLFEIMLN